MTTIALVVAVADNGVIGRQGQLPWRLPHDLQHFKALTLGHPVIMGRRTYDSIGRALPGRPNIVVTRQPQWQAPGCETAASVLAALARAAELDAEVVCVIGGGEIYREALPAADVVYLTEVHHTFEGDATFPPLSPTEWREETRERHEPDERHAHAYSFVKLVRR
jgi:dihydrofolate reductase